MCSWVDPQASPLSIPSKQQRLISDFLLGMKRYCPVNSSGWNGSLRAHGCIQITSGKEPPKLFRYTKGNVSFSHLDSIEWSTHTGNNCTGLTSVHHLLCRVCREGKEQRTHFPRDFRLSRSPQPCCCWHRLLGCHTSFHLLACLNLPCFCLLLSAASIIFPHYLDSYSPTARASSQWLLLWVTYLVSPIPLHIYQHTVETSWTLLSSL